MKVGDLVKIENKGWRHGGELGIILQSFPMMRTVEQEARGVPEPIAFKVWVSRGKVISKLSKQLELISESR